MSEPSVDSALAQRMTAMRESGRFAPAQLDAFAAWIARATDEELFRANPYDHAATRGVAPLDAIDLLVHAARAGIFDFAWGLVCPSCTAFIASRGGLKSLDRQRECAMCGVQAGSHLDDLVEVTFTINPAVRRTRFNGAWTDARTSTDQLMADASRVYFSSLTDLGAAIRSMIRERTQGAFVTRRGASARFDLALTAAGDWRVIAPSVHSLCRLHLDPGGATKATVEFLDGFVVPAELSVAPGPVSLTVINHTDEAELLVCAIRLDPRGDDGGEEDPDAEEAETTEDEGTRPFLSGKQILSTQSFRELFRAETLPTNASLEIRNLTFLFTDLKASTQLYDEIGDLAALGMVRSHFQVLRDVIARRGGAIVKTIGDAVMATFVDSGAAVNAGVEMHQRLREDPGARGLQLKVGIHAGPCVAIDSNERLDYFGQTVNIAARVQSLADGGELVCTDDVMKDPAVAAIFNGARLTATVEEAQLKGVSQAVRVYRAKVI